MSSDGSEIRLAHGDFVAVNTVAPLRSVPSSRSATPRGNTVAHSVCSLLSLASARENSDGPEIRPAHSDHARWSP